MIEQKKNFSSYRLALAALLATLALFVALSGCQPTPPVISSPTQTPTATRQAPGEPASATPMVGTPTELPSPTPLPTTAVAYPGPSTATPTPESYPYPPRSPTPVSYSPTPLVSATPTPVLPTPEMPDVLQGARLLYASSGELRLWSGGEPRTLAELGPDSLTAALSTDGQWAAFERQGGLWLVSTQGGEPQELLSRDDFNQLPPQDQAVELQQLGWLPNSQTLLFNTRILNNYGLVYSDDLYAIDIPDGQLRQLLAAGNGGFFYPSLMAAGLPFPLPNACGCSRQTAKTCAPCSSSPLFTLIVNSPSILACSGIRPERKSAWRHRPRTRSAASKATSPSCGRCRSTASRASPASSCWVGWSERCCSRPTWPT